MDYTQAETLLDLVVSLDAQVEDLNTLITTGFQIVFLLLGVLAWFAGGLLSYSLLSLLRRRASAPDDLL
jgi:hypothetical protein